MTDEELKKLNKIKQQKRDYYYRNRDIIRQKQQIYQGTPCGKANIKKAKAQYFQSTIKKANGGCATEAHKLAKNLYYRKQRMVLL